MAEERDPLLIKHADSFEYFNRDGMRLQKLIGRVEIEYQKAVILADTAVHSPVQERIDFYGRIRLDVDSQQLEADRVTFFKRDSTATAKGHVVLRDPKARSTISGGDGRYNRAGRHSRIWNDPVLLKVDSVKQDTLKIVSKVMEHFGDDKKALAIDKVVLTQSHLRAYCGRAEYRQDIEVALLMDHPVVYNDSSRLQGDTIRLFFVHDTLKYIRVDGKASGLFVEENKRKPDSVQVTQIRGDTLFAYLTAGDIDSMIVQNRAECVNHSRADSSSPNVLSGKRMQFYFTENALDSVHVAGSAKSTYYYSESGGSLGRNMMSGDTLNLFFAANRVSRIMARGAIQGSFYE